MTVSPSVFSMMLWTLSVKLGAGYDYAEYLKRQGELARKVVSPETEGGYPCEINSKAKQALYDNLNHDLTLALRIFEAVNTVKPAQWRKTKMKQRTIESVIAELIPDDEELQQTIFNIIFEHKKEF